MYCRVAATFRNLFKTLVLVETATSKALRLFYFMTREEKCKLAIERGFTYDADTGLIYNRYGKALKYMHYKTNYIQLNIVKNKKNYPITGHQFAWYWVNKECVEEIDHINGIKHDNRICNLRSVTRQQNQWNRTTSKGYTWNKKDKKWQAQIQVNKKVIYLGSYNTEEEARNAYLQAKGIYHKF